jgi:tryptophanyl-tRNA synthetase
MESELVPIRRRATELRKDPGTVDAVLAAGAERCRDLAADTMRGVRERMGFD